MRYDIFFAPTFPDGHVSNFLLDYSQTGAAGRLPQIRPQNGSDCGCDQNYHDFAPRLGLAYRLTGKTVLRAGFGIIFAEDDTFYQQSARWVNQSPDFVEYSLATVDRINPLPDPAGRLPGRHPARDVGSRTRRPSASTSSRPGCPTSIRSSGSSTSSANCRTTF